MNIEERNQIIIENMNLVHYIAKKYKNTNIEYDDLVSYGYEGLVKCSEKYDETKSKFATFAVRCIQNEINMALRRELKHKYNLSLDQKLYAEEIPIEAFIEPDQENTPEQIYLKKNNKIEIRKLINELQGFEKDLITLRYGFNNDIILTQAEVGDKYNMTQSCVSRKEKKILEKLQKSQVIN